MKYGAPALCGVASDAGVASRRAADRTPPYARVRPGKVAAAVVDGAAPDASAEDSAGLLEGAIGSPPGIAITTPSPGSRLTNSSVLPCSLATACTTLRPRPTPGVPRLASPR